jgi:hypothetical protein
MLNFKVEKLNNIKFSFDELVNYYKEIKDNYPQLECRSSVFPNGYSYAMQTKLPDTTLPCPPFHMPGETGVNNNFDTPTPLMFGFAKKILDKFPYAKQLVITVHGPGAIIEFHTDDEIFLSEEHIKIHLPIESNNNSYFQYDDEEFVLEPGHAYLVNTTIPHGTDNRGTTERAHMIFKVPVSAVDDILTREVTL